MADGHWRKISSRVLLKHNPLPENPTFAQRLRHPCLCPPHSSIAYLLSQGINLSTGVAGGVRLGPRGCFAGMCHCWHLLYSRVLSYLPGHMTRFSNATRHLRDRLPEWTQCDFKTTSCAVVLCFRLFLPFMIWHARKFSANCTVPDSFVIFASLFIAEVFFHPFFACF